MSLELPYLTNEFAAIGGKIKLRPDDFCVEEVPLYEASGEGTHIYFQIEKRELTTMDAAAAIARALGRARMDIGVAGQKDANAVARQWMSVEHVKPEVVAALEIPKLKVLKITRHKNKLKMGHLKSNKFKIKLRETLMGAEEAAKIAAACMEKLAAKGVPNYYGGQRFGSRGDSHVLGEFIAKGMIDEFVDQLLGRATEGEMPAVIEARQMYEKGRYEEAAKLWPWSFADQRRAVKALIDSGGNKRKAYNVVDKGLKKLLVSAFQSDIFNEVLTARMPNIDKILTGDMAYKHDNGAMFAVTDGAAEQGRCERFEISPTGPLVGVAMRKLEGQAGEIENPIIERAGLSERDMEQIDNFVRGGRRALRFKPMGCKVEAGKDEMGAYVYFEFELDSGCYATGLMREVCKREL